MSSAASSDPRDQKVANAKSEGSGHLWIFRGLAKIDKMFSQARSLDNARGMKQPGKRSGLVA